MAQPRSLTDEQLIDLLEQTPLAELPLEVIAELKRRVSRSAAIRDALRARLQLEQALGAALANPSVSVERVLEEAARQRPPRGSRWGWLYAFLLVLLTATVTGTFWEVARRRELARANFEHIDDGGDPARARGEAAKQPATVAPPDGSADPKSAAAPATMGADPAAPAEPPKPGSGTEPAATPAQPTAAPSPAPPRKVELPAQPWPGAPKDWHLQRPALFAEQAFSEFTPRSSFDSNELRRWLDRVPNQGLNLGQDRDFDRDYGWAEGVARLKVDWVEHSVLTVGICETKDFALHFWLPADVARNQKDDQPHGITLRQHKRWDHWAAYAAWRKDGGSKVPSRSGLLTTDDGRLGRLDSGSVQIRWQAGQLLLLRGAYVLLSVPMSAPPAEVIMQGRAKFRGLAMGIAEPVPPESFPPVPVADDRPVLLEGLADTLAWETALPERATWATQLDHSAALEVLTDRSKNDEARCLLPARADGPVLAEYAVQVLEATPGSGLFLADAQGEPVARLGFHREEQTNATIFRLVNRHQRNWTSGRQTTEEPLPWLAGPVWLRLVVGPSLVRCFVSSDGVAWGEACEPLREDLPPLSRLGVYGFRSPETVRIRVGAVQVREIAGLRRAVPKAAWSPAHLARAREVLAPLANDHAPEAFLLAVAGGQPKDLAPHDWRLLCAWQMVATNPRRHFSEYLLERLALGAAEQGEDNALRFFADTVLIAGQNDWSAGQMLLRLAAELSRQIGRGGEGRPWSRLFPELLYASAGWGQKFTALPGDLWRQELFSLVAERRWAELLDAADRYQFYNYDSNPHHRNWDDGRYQERRLCRWAFAQARAGLAEPAGKRVSRLPGERRETADTAVPNRPLTSWRDDRWEIPHADDGLPSVASVIVDDWGKEAYGLLVDVRAALRGSAWDDAARRLMGIDFQKSEGWTPDSDDPERWATLRVMVPALIREHPPLAELLRARHAAIGDVRARQGIAQRDEAMVASVALLFPGSSAAQQAHRWLGDQALVRGKPLLALDQYRRLPPSAQGDAEVAPRLLLARALLGEAISAADQGSSLPTLDPGKFRELLEDLRLRTRRAVDIAEEQVREPIPAADSATFAAYDPAKEPARWSEFPDAFVKPYGEASRVKSIFYRRQQVAAGSATKIYFASRQQLTARNRDNGAALWTHYVDEKARREQPPWLETPTPLVVAKSDQATPERVYWRRPARDPDLIALSGDDGKELWRFAPAGEFVLVDPLWLQDSVVVLTAKDLGQVVWRVEWVRLDPESGRVLERRPLIRLARSWRDEAVATWTLAGNTLVVSLGSATLALDAQGEPRWLRRAPMAGTRDYPSAVHQEVAPPLVIAATPAQPARVIVAPFGIPFVDAYDLESGTLVWRRVADGLRRVRVVPTIPEGGQQVLLETEARWLLADAGTGQMIREQPISATVAAGPLATTPGHLLTAESVSMGFGRDDLLLVERAVATGQVTRRWPIRRDVKKDPNAGLLFADPATGGGNRPWWLCVGVEERLPPRDVVTFADDWLASVPRLPLAAATGLAAWQTPLPAEMAGAAEATLPGWVLCNGRFERRLRDLAEQVNPNALLVAGNATPLLLQEAALPADGATELVLDFAVFREKPAKIEVAINGQLVHTYADTPAGDNRVPGWVRQTIDLAAYAGQTVMIAIKQSGGDAVWRLPSYRTK